LLDSLADVGFLQAAAQAMAHGLAEALAGRDLLLDAADHGGIRGDFHPAVRTLGEHAFPFQIGVSPPHHLGMGEQLLGQRPVLGKASSGREGPRGDMAADLAGNLLMDRHRGIVLHVNHDRIEATAD
jgi:hypothetical protein